MFLKEAGKVGGVFETQPKGDFLHRLGTEGQERLGLGNGFLSNLGVDGLAGFSLDYRAEVAGMQILGFGVVLNLKTAIALAL